MGIEYVSACQSWGAQSDTVVLKAEDGKVIGQIPFRFLHESEATRTVSYLRYLIRNLLSISVSEEVILIHDGVRLDDASEAVITPGVYIYTSSTSAEQTLLKGPQGKSRSRPFRDTDGASTVSRSSRSSDNQSNFRERLFLRDGCCLVTGNENDETLIAAHIVPYSLGQDFLDELTSRTHEVTLFSVSNGLTLRSDIHRLFDRFYWGVYVDESGRHYIHVFGEDNQDLHGKRIDYRCRTSSKLPHESLLKWHYQQCLMARIRGFHVG